MCIAGMDRPLRIKQLCAACGEEYTIESLCKGCTKKLSKGEPGWEEPNSKAKT